jgi:secondary thiamine-phosphate synthase enzyme
LRKINGCSGRFDCQRIVLRGYRTGGESFSPAAARLELLTSFGFDSGCALIRRIFVSESSIVVNRGTPINLVSMRVVHDELVVDTKGKGTYEITDAVRGRVEQCGIRHGIVTLFVRHTSCSLTLMENAAPAARRDMERFFEKLVPEHDDYEHDDEGPDDMPSHIRMVLTRTSETIPVTGGKMQLGTWQGIFLFEHRRAPHRRRLTLTIIGE